MKDSRHHACSPHRHSHDTGCFRVGWRLLVLAGCLLGLVGTAAAAGSGGTASSLQTATGVDPLARIEQDYRQGRLTHDEWAVLTVTAVTRPETLPDEYRAAAVTNLRGATPALVQVIQSWMELSPPTRLSLSRLLARPGGSFSFVSPSGYFRLHYDTAGANGVPPADDDASGTPDFVERVAAYLDSALAEHVRLGYRLPPGDGTNGGDSLLDVYFEDMPYYGYAVPEVPGPQPWNDYTSYLVLHRNFIGFPPNTDPEGNVAGAAKVTAAHEFHHCVQFGYDVSEYGWFMELDATYFEDIAFDQVNDNYNYLPGFMDYPEESLMSSGIHMYASFIWAMFLAEKFDTTLLVSGWEGARSVGVDIFTSIADSLQAYHGWSIDSAFSEFTVWNYITGARDDGLHYSEASAYPEVVMYATHSAYPVLTRTVTGGPGGYAAAYVEFLPGNASGPLDLRFVGAAGTEWGAYLIKQTLGGQYEVEQLVVDSATRSATKEIADLTAWQRIVLVGINLSEFGDPATFTYSLTEPSPYAVDGDVLTDTAVYSGATRLYEYQVINPSAVGEVYDVYAWDDSGWVAGDTNDIFLAPGQSKIVTFAVTPPVGTPLGARSTLYFRTDSRSDSLVFDQRTALAVTVVQYGDVNFDGAVDVSDLTGLISHLFITFAPLTVPEAGDIDCNGTTDVSDLTQLIDWLFINFTPSPCNPF